MRLLIVGGVFGQSAEFRRRLPVTPETTLVDGLQSRGHDVHAVGHAWNYDLREIDVVHVHHLAKGLVPLLRSTGTPWAFTRHGMQDATGARRLVLRAALRGADVLVALSDSEHALLERRSDNVVRIYNGQDSTNFWRPDSPQTVPKDGQAWRFLFVGQLTPLKRVDLVLRAIAAVNARGIEVHCEFVYHHATEENALRGLADDLGVTDCVTFTGALNRGDLAQRMRESHFLCLPSMTEALPSVITEAALCGLPVIATAVGGIAEQVAEPNDLVPLQALDTYPSRVVDALVNYEHRARAAHSWAPKARERFSIGAMIDAHEQLYERLCI